MGDAYLIMGMRLFPDICVYPVSQIASTDVCLEGGVLRLLSLAYHMLFFKL